MKTELVNENLQAAIVNQRIVKNAMEIIHRDIEETKEQIATWEALVAKWEQKIKDDFQPKWLDKLEQATLILRAHRRELKRHSEAWVIEQRKLVTYQNEQKRFEAMLAK